MRGSQSAMSPQAWLLLLLALISWQAELRERVMMAPPTTYNSSSWHCSSRINYSSSNSTSSSSSSCSINRSENTQFVMLPCLHAQRNTTELFSSTTWPLSARCCLQGGAVGGLAVFRTALTMTERFNGVNVLCLYGRLFSVWLEIL